MSQLPSRRCFGLADVDSPRRAGRGALPPTNLWLLGPPRWGQRRDFATDGADPPTSAAGVTSGNLVEIDVPGFPGFQAVISIRFETVRLVGDKPPT